MTLAFIIGAAAFFGGWATVATASSPPLANMGFVALAVGFATLIVTTLVWLFA